jgi:hypothetical protein
MDSDCGGFLGGHMGNAITDGTVTFADYTTALTHMFKVRMRLGQFDPPSIQPYMQYGTDKIDTPAHRNLALSAAKQVGRMEDGIVLGYVERMEGGKVNYLFGGLWSSKSFLD